MGCQLATRSWEQGLSVFHELIEVSRSPEEIGLKEVSSIRDEAGIGAGFAVIDKSETWGLGRFGIDGFE